MIQKLGYLVQINQKMGKIDTSLDLHMLGILISFDIYNDDTLILEIDTRGFDAHNIPLMKLKYYTGKGRKNPKRLTSLEAGTWGEFTTLYTTLTASSVDFLEPALDLVISTTPSIDKDLEISAQVWATEDEKYRYKRNPISKTLSHKIPKLIEKYKN
jgi:hypothetical protein